MDDTDNALSCDCVNVSASIVITTRNRKQELRRALESSFAQQGVRLEVLVYDDASTDGTAEYVREQWPEARLIVNADRRGLIVNRNCAFRDAVGQIVVSMDDDAYFTSDDIVAAVVRTFVHDDTIGAVAIPYYEPESCRSKAGDKKVYEREKGGEVSGFRGCAHAVRRDAAKQVGLYRDYFVHQGEERDFCLRLQAAGWRIVYGDCKAVVHMVSGYREARRMTYYGARNRILFNWLNLPTASMVLRMIWDPVAVLKYRFAWSAVPTKVCGLGAGYLGSLLRFKHRAPVSRAVYKRYRELPGHGPERWKGGCLPEPCTGPLAKRRAEI